MKDMQLLIEPLIPSLRRFARSVLRDRSLADDLVQDCLEHAVGRWRQRRSDGDVRAWVFAILHNLILNHLRKTRRRGRDVAIEDVDEAQFGRAPTQEDALRHRDLLQALDELPEEQRSVLLLVSVEDLSYAETAKALDIPVGTVMSRLNRAREKVFRAVEGEAQESTHLRVVK